MSTIKLGIVGAGFVAHFHARAIQQVRSMEIAGVTALDKAESLSAFVKKHNLGAGTVYPNIAEMAENVDVIAVYVPNFARLATVEQIVEAVKKGRRFEGRDSANKPLGRNVKEARKLVELADSVGLKTAYFENQIFMKPVQSQLAQLAPQQKTMGPLALTRSAEEHGGPHEGWFWDPTRQGGRGAVRYGLPQHRRRLVRPDPDRQAGHLPQAGVHLGGDRPAEVGLTLLARQAAQRARRGLFQDPRRGFHHRMVTFQNPETGQKVKAQFTDSWMFEKQGLRLFMDGMGPGYAFEINTLASSLQIFIGDAAAEATANAERGAGKVHRFARVAGGAAQRGRPVRLHRRERRCRRRLPGWQRRLPAVELRAGDHQTGDGGLHVSRAQEGD